MGFLVAEWDVLGVRIEENVIGIFVSDLVKELSNWEVDQVLGIFALRISQFLSGKSGQISTSSDKERYFSCNTVWYHTSFITRFLFKSFKFIDRYVHSLYIYMESMYLFVISVFYLFNQKRISLIGKTKSIEFLGKIIHFKGSSPSL